MYEVRIAPEKNRMYLTLRGFMMDEELQKAADTVIAEMKKLKPGFTTINDISDFKPATPEGAEHIKRAQKALSDYGMARVIRVVHEKIMGAMQFNRTSREREAAQYLADTAPSVEEAERMLDSQ